MAVIYRGEIPDKNYTVLDFYNKGITISWFAKFKIGNNKTSSIRCIFRSNGLLGEIRSCGNTFAVDVYWGWCSNEKICLTTECKSLREAKSILYIWFRSKGFKVDKKDTDSDWSKNTLRYDNIQLNLNPIIFK